MELQKVADELNDKKLFYTGIYFNPNDKGNETNASKDISYTIRMDIDNTPKTIENRNRFWFPGPEDSFTQDMRYHRGFIIMQYAIDMGIIKWHKKQQLNERKPNGTEERKVNGFADWDLSGFFDRPTDMNADNVDGGDDDEDSKSEVEIDFGPATTDGSPATDTNSFQFDDDIEDFLNFEENSTTSETARNRTRRSPQLDGLLSMLTGGSKKPDESDDKFNIDDMRVYTKMFPYPKYRQDDFKKGLYMSQAVQITFFFGLLVQIASAVRHRIWMKESGNKRVC